MNGDDGDGQQLVIDCKEQTALNRPVQLWFTIASQQGYPRPLVRGESNAPENTRGLQTESPPPTRQPLVQPTTRGWFSLRLLVNFRRFWQRLHPLTERGSGMLGRLRGWGEVAAACKHGGQALRPQMPKSEEAAFTHVIGCDVIATVVVVGAACFNGSAPSLAEPTRGPCRIA